MCAAGSALVAVVDLSLSLSSYRSLSSFFFSDRLNRGILCCQGMWEWLLGVVIVVTVATVGPW